MKSNIKNHSTQLSSMHGISVANDGFGAYRASELLDHMEAMYDSDIDDTDNH